MDPHRRVLMIAYAFPPTGGPGVQRSAKFAKYLPQFGWLPTVWTVDDAVGLPRDESLCEDIPAEVAVCGRSPGSGILAMRRTLRGFVNPRAGEGLTTAASRFVKAIDWRLESWVAATAFPDDCIAWAKRSVRPLLHRLGNEPIEAIYSTYSPASNHWLGLELKRRTNLPWAADFRDLWTDDCRYREPSAQRRAAHRRLEQQILETADVVIGVTPRQTAILAERVTTQRKKFITITNGFDPADFDGLPQEAPTRRGEFVLSYVGRFDLSQTSEAWFAALRRFVAELGEQASQFLFRIVGSVNRTAQARLVATGARCEFAGYVPHREAITAMCDADALLLNAPTGPNGDSVIRAKVFEYLASRRPILCVGPRGGECERIVRSCAAGVTAGFEEDAILRGLHRLFDAWRADSPLSGAAPERIAEYSRIELSRRLAGVLDGLPMRDTRVDESREAALESCAR